MAAWGRARRRAFEGYGHRRQGWEALLQRVPSPSLHILTSPLSYFLPTQKYAKPRLPSAEGE